MRVRSAGPLSTILPEASRTAVAKISATEQMGAETGLESARSPRGTELTGGEGCTGVARASVVELDEAGAPDEFELVEGVGGDKASPEELLSDGGTGRAGGIRDKSANLLPEGVIGEVAGS